MELNTIVKKFILTNCIASVHIRFFVTTLQLNQLLVDSQYDQTTVFYFTKFLSQLSTFIRDSPELQSAKRSFSPVTFPINTLGVVIKLLAR